MINTEHVDSAFTCTSIYLLLHLIEYVQNFRYSLMDSVFLFWVAGNCAGLHKTMPASKESRGSR